VAVLGLLANAWRRGRQLAGAVVGVFNDAADGLGLFRCQPRRGGEG
jgi:hypothetical protein